MTHYNIIQDTIQDVREAYAYLFSELKCERVRKRERER